MKAPFSLQDIPTQPGCYMYKDREGTIIYIGKAKELKKRVSSYFSSSTSDLKTAQLLTQIVSVEWIITKNEVEALLLESSLIRQHKPKYNIDLKYAIRYAWICLTDETYPRLIIARNKTIKGEYFGPFVNGQLRTTLVHTLRKTFYIRTCNVLPKKPCLKYHIGVCKAPCVKYQSKEDYQKHIETVRMYLRGKNNDLVQSLQKEMIDLAKNQAFEQAQIKKQQIEALEFLQERILVEQTRIEEEDVIHYTNIRTTQYKFVVLSFRRGVLDQKEEFSFDQREDFDAVLDSFVKRYYDIKIPPKQIIIPHAFKDAQIKEYLSEKANYAVLCKIPKQGIKKELLQMAYENVISTIDEGDVLAKEMATLFGFEQPIHTIECFDISHLSGSYMVGSMACFVNGKPKKSEYRRFKINTVQGIDDFRAMKEIVGRRYARLKAEKKSFPDLIVIDGGEIQLQFAKQALDDLNLNIPIIGLAKKFEEIYYPHRKEPKRFDKKTNAMKTLIMLRDETHRFGITYHRSLRSKAIKEER